MGDVKERDWYGCYGESWMGIIVDDSFAHPAKFSRTLIRCIYDHAVEQGWLKPGDNVLDPFGGVALGALHAMKHGLHWLGMEIEEKFVKLGNRNLELWNETYRPHLPGWGSAVLVQGDSRELCGVLAEACVSSPPFGKAQSGGGINVKGYGEDGRDKVGDRSYNARTHNSNEANLGALPEGDHDAVVSSPPYARGCQHTGGDDPNPEHLEGGEYHGVGMDGCVSCPPYTASLASDDPDKRGGLYRDPKCRNDKTLTAEYGQSEGQMGQMQEGEFRAAVSSPPWESTEGTLSAKKFKDPAKLARDQSEALRTGKVRGNFASEEAILRSLKRQDRQHYGDSDGNLNNDGGETFWSAARQIMEQVYRALRPGGVAIWVTKAFVRDGERVDFPGQWRALGEACGFETIEWIHAWLVEDRGAQYDLFGELHERKVERKSFFRRLYEKKHPDMTIDYEVVIVQRKPK